MQLLWQDETKFATLFTKKEQNQSGSVPKAAVDRNRTGTGITTHGILSPGRLPVPPLRHMDGDGFEPSKQFAADLQSVPFGHSGICPFKTFNMKLTHFNSQNKLRKADDRTRTDNLLITNQLLCQLSHIGVSNGTYRARTYDPLLVRQMLSQLS